MKRLHKILLCVCTLFCLGVFASSIRAETIPFFAQFPNIDLSHWYISHGWANGSHQSCTWRSDHIEAKGGYLFLKLSDQKTPERDYSCAEIQSKKRYGYGRYEARMRTAVGSGLNTAFFTYIGPSQGVEEHDEIDFEFIGKKNNLLQVTYHRAGRQAKVVDINLPFNPSEDFHTYRFDWLPDQISWYVDGKLVYQTPETEADDIPVHQSKIFFSLWSGAKSINDWLGPFKYKEEKEASVAWVRHTPLHVLEP